MFIEDLRDGFLVRSYNNCVFLVITLFVLSLADHEHEADIVRAHVARIREIPKYEKSLFIIIVEANMSRLVSDRLGKIASTAVFPSPYYVMSNNGKVGVFTDHDVKMRYAFNLNELLLSRRIVLEEKVVGADSAKSIKTLMKQLTDFSEKQVESTNPGFGTRKVTMTGKEGGKMDDICMSLQIGLYWASLLEAREDFVHYCQRLGFSLDSQ
jgi:hypothetical protein